MEPVRIAQYGTRHGHAAGKHVALETHPEVELVGLFEPDPELRRQLQGEDGAFSGAHFIEDEAAILDDGSIVAVASEGANHESLDQTERLVEAGKQVWYDKPAGDDWEQWKRIVARAQEQSLTVQMGYMFRYHEGFRKMAAWVQAGLLGELFAVRGHMSTNAYPADGGLAGRLQIAEHHRGGIYYDLSGHLLDQVVWLLGRPHQVTSFLRNDTGLVPEFSDNALSVFEFDRAMAMVDIAAMEMAPMARRFELYGSRGSAIMEPFDGAMRIRLCLQEAWDGFDAGEQFVTIQRQSRQRLYELELDAFVATVRGERQADRTLEHELLVQETVLRGTGQLT